MSQDSTSGITGDVHNKNKKTGLLVGLVVCLILAIGGIGFGVWNMIQSSQKDSQISDLKVQIKGDELVVDVAYIHIFEDLDGKQYVELDSGKTEIVDERHMWNSLNYIKKDRDEFPRYRLTFKKEGQNYIFTSINKL